MSEKRHILNKLHSMEIGQEMVISRHTMQEVFPPTVPFGIYENSVQHLLSNLMGSGCGAYRAFVKPENGDVVVSRHEESDKRYYVDPDRAYMFNKMPDGTLELKEEYKR